MIDWFARCPHCGFRRWWLPVPTGLSEGPLFRPLSWHGRRGAGLSDRSVAEIVKARAALAGYDPREFGVLPCAYHQAGAVCR